MTTSSASCLAIVGVGNLLRTDDGVGVHALRMLQAEPIPGVDLLEVGTAILHGVDTLADADRILVLDAVQAGHLPGTIHCLEADSLDHNPVGLSMHTLGLREAFCLLSPERRPLFTVLGTEPGSLDYGTNLTPAVAASLPRLVAKARVMAQRWREEPAAAGRPDRMVGTRELEITS